MDMRAWAVSPVPKAPGQERSGAAGASVERLPADHRVQSGRWAWGQGNFVSGECPAGGTSQEREKDLRSLHRSATRRVWAGVPAWLRGAVGALAGHRPEESQVGHKRKLGASNAYGLRLPAVPPIGSGRKPSTGDEDSCYSTAPGDVGHQTWDHPMLVAHACKSHT